MTTAVENNLAYIAGDDAEARASMVAAANELIPLLRAEAEQTEKDRRLTDKVDNALREAGLYQVCTPRRSGGGGGGVRTLVEVVAEISRGDGSAGWVSFIANTTAFMTGLLSDEARAHLYTHPHNMAVSQFGPNGVATPVEGGYIINGTWPFASGCLQSQFTISGFHVPGPEGQPPAEIGFALMSRDDLDIEDVWQVAGMKGTGSNNWTATNLFVPKEHTIDFSMFNGNVLTDFTPGEPGYRAPIGTAACLGIVAPLMGLAEAAWDLVLNQMQAGRPITAAYGDIRDAPSYRLALVDARTLIDSGRFHLLRAADRVDTAAQEGRYLELDERAAIRGDAAAATRAFRDSVDRLLDIGGTRSFMLSNPLQRVWRDLEVASRHGLNNSLINREEYGLALVGKEPAFGRVL